MRGTEREVQKGTVRKQTEIRAERGGAEWIREGNCGKRITNG